MNYPIEYAWFCHGGKVRPNNEDNVWCMGQMFPMIHEGSEEVREGKLSSAEAPVFAVFDGMGGESCGEVASYLGAKAFGESVEALRSLLVQNPEDFLGEACQRMNQEVLDYARANRVRTMGSTVAMAAFGEDHIGAGNLGDSRIYALFQGKLAQVSKDHVLSRSLFGKAPLTQYLGLPQEEMSLEPHLLRLPYRNGLRILLCSDGVTDMISERRIRDFLLLEDCGASARAILQEGLSAGGRDNLSAVVIRVLGQEAAPEGGEKRKGWLDRLFGRVKKERMI